MQMVFVKKNINVGCMNYLNIVVLKKKNQMKSSEIACTYNVIVFFSHWVNSKEFLSHDSSHFVCPISQHTVMEGIKKKKKNKV